MDRFRRQERKFVPQLSTTTRLVIESVMPGPRNRTVRKKKKKREIRRATDVPSSVTVQASTSDEARPPLESSVVVEVLQVAQVPPSPSSSTSVPSSSNAPKPRHKSYLDPADSGKRTGSVIDFIHSDYAEPPALSDPRYAPFARHDVLDVLRLYLPEELALVSSDITSMPPYLIHLIPYYLLLR